MLEEYDLHQIVEPLQTWFLENARTLPWRENPDAYHVWISEIMLQQTRVEAVKPYFARFIKELPDVYALAECPEDKYLKLWEGLGYYNRIRNMNEAAKQIVALYGGRIPDDYEKLLGLKGIGHYTAGAIASIAYNRPVPAVDGNVLRVISRISGDTSDIMKQSVRTNMEDKLKNLMNTDSRTKPVPRIFNQALMELGEVVCVPNGMPDCEKCPLNSICMACQQGKTEEIPVKSKAKARKIEKKTVFVIKDGKRVAIHKRAGRGLLAGLYEFPNHEGHMKQEEALSYIKSLGYAPVRICPLGNAKHIFSHVEWHMLGYAILVEEVPENRSDLIFAEVSEVRERYAIPAAFAKYAELMDINVMSQ